MTHSNTLYTIARDSAIRWGLPVACFALVAALALVLEYKQMKHTWMLLDQRVQLNRYFDGSIARPLAYRVLIPQTIRLLDRITPSNVAQKLESWADPIGRRMLPNNLPAEPRRLDYYFLISIQLLSLIGYAFMGHRLYCRLFPRTPLHWLVPVGFLAVLVPFVAVHYGHVYDFTMLLSMTALLYAIAIHNHRLYLVLFVISCFTKETTIFATVAYACYFVDRMPRPKFVFMMAAQAIAFLSIYSSLHLIYSANVGANASYMLWDQIKWLTDRTFPEYVSFLIVLLMIVHRFDEKPLVMRRMFGMAIANAAIYICAANIGEWRNFYESLPLLTLFVLRNAFQTDLVKRLGGRMHFILQQDFAQTPAMHYRVDTAADAESVNRRTEIMT